MRKGPRSNEAATRRHAPVTVRAVLLGLFGVVTVAVLQIASRARPPMPPLILRMEPFQSMMTLLTGPVLWLFLLAALNVLLRRFLPRAAFRPAELALVYGMTTVGAAIAAQDHVQLLWPTFVYPFRATMADRMGPFRQHIPGWMVPQDPGVVEPFYLGRENFWRPEILAAWVVPIASWFVWLVALGATMWAWNVLLRRRWVEHDRLSFPAVQLPLQMCREGGFGGMVSGKLFWSGFLVSALVESLQQINRRFPNVPAVPLDFMASPVIDAAPAPWKALAPMYLTWSTVHLGICYLIPTDILFSGWFFYLLRKLSEVWGHAMGWRDLGFDARGFPYVRAQAVGAWAMLFVLLVWAERRHLRRVLVAALFLSKERFDDEGEPGSYLLAGRLLVLGTLFLIGWSVYAGMSLTIAVAFYAFFWVLNVTMTRIYAQVGPPILELYFLDPQKTLTSLFGTAGHSPGALTQFSLMYWFNRTYRGHPMGHQLAAFAVGKATSASPRPLGFWVLVAFAVGGLTALIAYPHFAYKVGHDSFSNGWPFVPVEAIGRIHEWVSQPKGPQWTEIGFMGIGGALCWGLAKVNYTFIGTPFHPIGYALAVAYAVEYNWPAFFVIWIFKALILRYGGLPLYLRLIPFFFGLTLGGLIVPVFWAFTAWLFRWYS